MKSIFIFILFISFANGANLLTHNIYERTDRVDIMLSFDSPYEGKITQKRDKDITTLILSDLSYDRLIEKKIDSKIVQVIAIKPSKDSVNIALKSHYLIAVIASKTVDGFGLRIRIKPVNQTPVSQTNQPTQSDVKTPIQTKPSESLVDGRYLSVIFLLLIMVVFTLWIKRRVMKKGGQAKAQNSWLFSSSNLSHDEVSVIHQKRIDNSNSVVLLEFQDRKYLVMTGSSNLLLEKFSKGDIKDDSDFEKAFEDNRKKLDEYLKIQTDEEIEDDYRSKLERH